MREAFTIARGMPQSNRISAGIETDLVSARVPPSAIRSGIDGPQIPMLLHAAYYVQQSAGRRVFLLIVMNLPGPCPVCLLITQEFSGEGGQLSEDCNAG